jgi:hypothetical protein
MAASDRATAKQLRHLRALAEQTGTTFATHHAPPGREAIDQLRRGKVEPPSERWRQRCHISDDLARPASASAARPDEIVGYGSTRTGADGGLR